MMRAIQNSSGSIIMKIVLGAIAVSFALWGVGDMFRGGMASGYAIKAGDKTVTIQEYQDELNIRYGALRQVMGASLTPEMAERLGLKQQVLNDLQTGLLLQLEAKSLGLKIPESEVMKLLRETPAFQSEGAFNKDSFDQALRQAGLNEERFLNSLNKELLSKLILQNFSTYLPDVTNAASLLYRTRNETRDVTFYRFTPNVNNSEIAEPDEAALKDYYKAYGEQFREPEYRQIQWVTIDKQAIGKDFTPDDETLLALYDERIDSYTIPQQREVSQLLYETQAEAEKALSMLNDGSSFAQVVSEVKPTNEMLSLGIITGDALPSQARDDVMALQAGEVSKPIKTDFGWHLFRVESIKPQSITPFAQAREKLATDWRSAKIEDAAYEITVDIEDGLAGGLTLDEVAKEHNLKVSSAPVMNMSALNKSGKPIDISAYPAGLIESGFKLQDETDSHLLDAGNGNYQLIALGKREESYIPKISDINDKLVAAWRTKQTRDAIRNKSITLAQAIAKDGSKLNSDIFRPIRVSGFQTAGDVPSQLGNVTELPPGLRDEIFQKSQGETTDAYIINLENDEYMLAKVDTINRISKSTANGEKAQAEIEKIVAELQQQFGQDITSLYMKHLVAKYPITVNEQAMAQLNR